VNPIVVYDGRPLTMFNKATKAIVPMDHATWINHPEWKHLRNIRLLRDNFECQQMTGRWGKSQCKSKDRLEVHHLTYERMTHERIDDLITVCHKCHSKIHGRKT